jgi:ribose/xylose/arabinose/galactoside ABC-type transport system permease subunit
VQRVLITLGVLFLLAGLAWPWLARLGLGRLPGDINVERDGWSFHFPLVTSLVISIVLSLLVWLLRK